MKEKSKDSAGVKAVESSLKAYYREVKKVSYVAFLTIPDCVAFIFAYFRRQVLSLLFLAYMLKLNSY